MVPLEAEDAAIRPNVIEVRGVLISDNPVIAQEKSGYYAHEGGDAHSEEKIPPVIDQSYELAEIVFHGGKEDRFVPLNLMNNSSNCQWI
jgi:hypothetical protein